MKAGEGSGACQKGLSRNDEKLALLGDSFFVSLSDLEGKGSKSTKYGRESLLIKIISDKYGNLQSFSIMHRKRERREPKDTKKGRDSQGPTTLSSTESHGMCVWSGFRSGEIATKHEVEIRS